MNIGTAFNYIVEDDDWIKKLAIGSLITLVAYFTSGILVGLLLVILYYGYWLQTLQNVRDGQPTPLPEWSNFGDLFSKGGKVFAIATIYNLPVVLFVCCAIALIVPAAILEDQNIMNGMGVLISCLMCITMIVTFVANLILPAAIIRFSQDESIGSAFKFGEIFGFIKSNMSDYLIAIVVLMVAGFVGGFIGTIACGIGVFITSFYILLVNAHLFGQLARRMNGEANIPQTQYVGL
jgi:hypothetical protein